MSNYQEDESVIPNQIENTVLMCNKQAMEYLHKNNYADAIRFLQKASQILTNLTPTYTVIKLKAVTLNNLGCLYKRGNDNAKALQYLTQALEYENRLPEESANMAGTHLNLCAIKSHLNNHDDALNHALKAINIIQRNYSGHKDFTTTLVAAYHNTGVEYQFLNRKIEANNFFRQGYELALRKLGKEHNLTKSLENYVANQRKNQLEAVNEKSERNRSNLRARDLKLKADSVFKPESGMFEEESDTDIKVDMTPWPKSTAKKNWPVKVEPLGFAESTPKPFAAKPYQRNEVEIRKKITQPAGIFHEKMKERAPPKVKTRDLSMDLKKKSSKVLQSDTSENSRPGNVHLQHKEEAKATFKLRSKVEPPSSKSLNSSPSKSSSYKTVEGSSKKQNSIPYLNPVSATDKINQISAKLESLQGKLNSFEQTYKNLNTLKEEDTESIISTTSMVNNRRVQAAILIQKHYRRYIFEKKFNIKRNAAKKIQKVVRGISTRRKIHRDLYKSEDFSQQYSKEPNPEPIVIKTVESSNQTDAVVKRFNGEIILVARSLCKPVRKRKTLLQNIILIQSHFRRILAKKYCKKRLHALVKIQKAVKQFRIRTIFRKVVSAVIFIQAVYRGYRARKFVRSMLPKDVIAILQSKRMW